MQRDSSSKRLATWLAAVALGIATTGAAQAQPDAAVADDADAAAKAEQPAPAAESPRRTRERRNARAATNAAETPAEAAAAPATPATAAAALVEPPAETVEARIVCKNYKPTGSRMARRVCGTPEQWAAIGEATSENAEENMRQIRERSAIASPIDNPLNPND